MSVKDSCAFERLEQVKDLPSEVSNCPIGRLVTVSGKREQASTIAVE